MISSMFRFSWILVRLVAFTALLPLQISVALTIRHDIPLDTYVQYGMNPDFNPVGRLQLGNYSCTGTLIDPLTILTASHCLREAPKQLDGDYYFQAAHRVRPLLGWRQVWTEGLPTPDVALVYLADPILDIEPARLAQKEPQAIVGHSIYMAGFGQVYLGDGSSLQGYDKIKLAGWALVSVSDDVYYRTELKDVNFVVPIPGYSPSTFRRVDSKPDAGCAPGASGGPMFRRSSGGIEIAAVIEGSEKADFRYGLTTLATRIIPHLAFIRNAMAYRELETTGEPSFNPSPWRILGTQQDWNFFSYNVDRHDRLGMQFQSFRLHVNHDVVMERAIELKVTELLVHKGTLQLGNEVCPGFLSVKRATLHSNLCVYLIDWGDLGPNSGIQSDGLISLDNSRIDVVVQLGWRHRQRIPYTPQPTIPILSSLGSAIVGVIERVAERSSLEKFYEWTILSSNTAIEGKYFVQIRCDNPDYEVSTVREPKRLIIRATRR